jgi:hypothetical protein
MERELKKDNQSQKMELDLLRKEIPTAYFTMEPSSALASSALL